MSRRGTGLARVAAGLAAWLALCLAAPLAGDAPQERRSGFDFMSRETQAMQRDDALNPDTVMPPYYRVEGLTRVAAPWRGKPVLSAAEIEDVVAFLTGLRE